MKLIDNSAKTNWKFIAIIEALGLILGGIILLVLFSCFNSIEDECGGFSSVKSIPYTVHQTPSLVPQPQALDTSTWQTYRNEEFGFEMRYPPLWSENSSGDGATLGENRIDIGIIVWNDGSTEYVETQWKQIDCAPGNDPNGGCSPLYNKEEKKLSLNSYTVYFKIDGRGQMHAYIPNPVKNKTVEIYTVYLTDRKIFDQILSTFRFVGQE